MADSLTLRFADIETDVLTGIYSEETGKPQPLRITVEADYKVADRYDPDTPLDASKNYMDLKFAATDALPEVSISSLSNRLPITFAKRCLRRITTSFR